MSHLLPEHLLTEQITHCWTETSWKESEFILVPRAYNFISRFKLLMLKLLIKFYEQYKLLDI